MTQLERLKEIYILLVSEPLTKQEIIEKLGILISTKQIERDLKDIENHYLRNSEKLNFEFKSRKKVYSIQNKEKKRKAVSLQNLAVIDLILKSNNPLLFKNFKTETLLYERLTKALYDVYGNESGNFSKTIVESTNFYQLKKNVNFENAILKIYQAIVNGFRIHVQEILQDVTNENPNRKKSYTELIPLKIIFHRGDFYVAVIERNKLVVYEIAQFKEIDILDKKFSASKYINQLEELKHRFGVSKNIDDKIYTIKLQFSDSTGSFIEKMQWHETQIVQKIKNNYILTLNCGINRELVGWIFQWMHNIKILEPPELIDIYQQTLKEIEANKNVKSLFSRNMITQKRKTLS